MLGSIDSNAVSVSEERDECGPFRTFSSPQAKTLQTCKEKGRDGEAKKASQKKPGRQFFIRLNIVEVYDKLRSDFVDSFFSIASYCCCIEKSRSAELVNYNLHYFLESETPVLLSDLHEGIVSLFPDVGLDIKSCRSKKSRTMLLFYIFKF